MPEEKIAEKIVYIEELYGEKYKDIHKLAFFKKFNKFTDSKIDMVFDLVIDTFVPTTKVPLPLPPHYINAINSSHDITYSESDNIRYKNSHLDIKDGTMHSLIGDIAYMCSYGESYYIRTGENDIKRLIRYQVDHPGYPLISALRYERMLAKTGERAPVSLVKMLNNMPERESVEILIATLDKPKDP